MVVVELLLLYISYLQHPHLILGLHCQSYARSYGSRRGQTFVARGATVAFIEFH
jgi:hypothetical protein